MSYLTPLHAAWQCVKPHAIAPCASDERTLKEIRVAVGSLRCLSTKQLHERAAQLRAAIRSDSGKPARRILPAFALMAEALRRTLGLELFDVQFLAGLALARGTITEMQTGEGKTLAAALPAFLYGLCGRGVHVVTPNYYLAARDWRQLAPAYEMLGTSVGLLGEQVPAQSKRFAYACDITYGTGYEFGFDFLRDQLARLKRCRPELGRQLRDVLRGKQNESEAPLQRGHAIAIIDEIDSVLIDEACVPLVLSEASEATELEPAAASAYRAAHSAIAGLHEPDDFQVDRESRQVTLTESGCARIHHKLAGCEGQSLPRPWTVCIENALRAVHLYRRDIDYVVLDGRVAIVDEFTGRIYSDRTWRDGLHQAIEAKEGLAIRAELVSAVRVSRQRYFRLYEKLCGMTGTAAASQQEFWRQYKLPVVSVPLRIPSHRELLPTRYFRDLESKWRAIARDVAARHRAGQPVLIGSRTIENSELLADRLQQAQVPCCLLNGRQDLDEAVVIGKAGARGAVTIATNMAGRGTDIRLEPGVAALGGLHLIGVERHESARIDRQLMGRVGRQGDPGSCQFYVSADDPLLIDHAPDCSRRMRQSSNIDGACSVDYSREISRIQRRVEAAAAVGRRRLLTHDAALDELLDSLAKE